MDYSSFFLLSPIFVLLDQISLLSRLSDHNHPVYSENKVGQSVLRAVWALSPYHASSAYHFFVSSAVCGASRLICFTGCSFACGSSTFLGGAPALPAPAAGGPRFRGFAVFNGQRGVSVGVCDAVVLPRRLTRPVRHRHVRERSHGQSSCAQGVRAA